MMSRWVLSGVALLIAGSAAAACDTVGSLSICTAAPGVTQTASGAPGRNRVSTSNALVGASWDRHVVNEAGYSYAFGTDAEGHRWYKAEQRKPGSVFTLWPEKPDARAAPAPLPPAPNQ